MCVEHNDQVMEWIVEISYKGKGYGWTLTRDQSLLNQFGSFLIASS